MIHLQLMGKSKVFTIGGGWIKPFKIRVYATGACYSIDRLKHAFGSKSLTDFNGGNDDKPNSKTD